MAEKEDLKKKERMKMMLLIGLALVGGVIFLRQTLPVLLPRGGPAKTRTLAPLPSGISGEKVVIPGGPKVAVSLPPYKERDPFQYGAAAESAAPQTGTPAPAEAVTEEELVLDDIYEDYENNGKFIASINDEEYRVGDRVADWIVDSISASQVTLRKGKTRKVLKMEE